MRLVNSLTAPAVISIVFGLEQVGAIVDRQLEIVAVSDRVFRTSFDAEPAENAAAIIDVVNLREPLIDAGALSLGTRIVCRFDVDTLRRAGRRAEKAGHAFFTTQLVNVQQVLTAIAWLDRYRLVRILNCQLPPGNIRERDTIP